MISGKILVKVKMNKGKVVKYRDMFRILVLRNAELLTNVCKSDQSNEDKSNITVMKNMNNMKNVRNKKNIISLKYNEECKQTNKKTTKKQTKKSQPTKKTKKAKYLA